MGIIINNTTVLADCEVELSAIRSQGAGGQNVNKVSTAVHLRFDIAASSLPEKYKEKLLIKNDHHITSRGVIVIKAQRFRSQAKNKMYAIMSLVEIIKSVEAEPKKRRPTSVSRTAREKRLKKKTIRSAVKNMRKKVAYD